MLGSGCSCSSHIIWYGGKDYGNCKWEHSNGNGKFCYVNLPTTCSDAEQSSLSNTQKMSWEACKGKFFGMIMIRTPTYNCFKSTNPINVENPQNILDSNRRKRAATNDQGKYHQYGNKRVLTINYKSMRNE